MLKGTIYISYLIPETHSDLRAAVNALRVGIGSVCLSHLVIISRRQFSTFLSSSDMAASVPWSIPSSVPMAFHCARYFQVMSSTSFRSLIQRSAEYYLMKRWLHVKHDPWLLKTVLAVSNSSTTVPCYLATVYSLNSKHHACSYQL